MPSRTSKSNRTAKPSGADLISQSKKARKDRSLNFPKSSGLVDIDRERIRLLRKGLLQSANGTPEHQKNELVDDILKAFSNPEHWPVTDGERVKLLRRLYTRCVKIRDTEEAM